MSFFKDIIIRQSRLLQQVFKDILGLYQNKNLMSVIYQILGHILIEMKMSWMTQLDENIHGNFTNAVPSISIWRFSS